MKAIMKSVSPRICEKVANGDCTILVSKTISKCEMPFKCYIYCTKEKPLLGFHTDYVDGKGKRVYTDHLLGSIPYFNGKVIGEFICDKIIEWQYDKGHQYYVEYPDDCTSYFPYLKCHSEATGLKCSEIEKLGKGKPLYGLHISNLKIYDKPKELREFRKPCKINLPMCDRCEYYSTWNGRCENITRAPQGWCYVEEL